MTRKVACGTCWSMVRGYFAMHEGSVVERKRYMSLVDAPEYILDQYRCYLMRAGYLESVGRGKYKVVKPIPPTLTITQVYEEAYG